MNSNNRVRASILFMIRMALAGVFAFSAFSHLKHPHQVLDHVLAYQIVTGMPAAGVAMALPLFEFGMAVLLLSRLKGRIAGSASLILLLLFVFVQSMAFYKGLKIDCGCFGGVVRHEIGWFSIGFLGLLAMGALTVLLFSKPLQSQSDPLRPRRERASANPRLLTGCLAAGASLFMSGSPAVLAQEEIPPLPLNTEAFVHIGHPDSLAGELNWFRTQAATDTRLRKLFIEGDFPLTDDEGFESVLSVLESLESLIRSARTATLAVRGLQTETEYLLVLQLDPEGIGDFANRLADLGEILAPYFGLAWSPSVQAAELVAEIEQSLEVDPADQGGFFLPNDLRPDVLRWAVRLRPQVTTVQGQYLLLSNSPKWLEWTQHAIETGDRSETLDKSRRYQRAIHALGPSERRTALAWFVPALVFPLWDSTLTPEQLQRFGYEELVGAAASIDLGPRSQGAGSVARMKMGVPFTVPRQGVSKLWESYRTIDQIPEMNHFIRQSKDHLWKITIESRDRNEYFRLRQEVYESRGELNLLEQKLADEAQYHPSVENYRDFFDGRQIRLLMMGFEPHAQSYPLDFLAIRNRDATLEYARHSAYISAKESDVPKPEFTMHGFPSWFRSPEDNLRMVRNGFPEATLADRHLVRNPGKVATDQWLISGDLSQVREYLDTRACESVSMANELKELLPLSAEMLTSIQPSRLEIVFQGARRRMEVLDFRFRYLRRSMSVSAARNLARGWYDSVPVEESMPIRSPSDRLFAVADWGLYQLLTRYHYDILLFACRDAHFEWHWNFFPQNDDEWP